MSTAASDLACWIQNVTLVELGGDQALLINLHPAAELGERMELPLVYFPFLQRALKTMESACGWILEGASITSAIRWPELEERYTVCQLHNLFHKHQLFTLFRR